MRTISEDERREFLASAAAGLVAQHRAEALAIADTMFATRPAPYCTSFF